MEVLDPGGNVPRRATSLGKIHLPHLTPAHGVHTIRGRVHYLLLDADGLCALLRGRLRLQVERDLQQGEGRVHGRGRVRLLPAEGRLWRGEADPTRLHLQLLPEAGPCRDDEDLGRLVRATLSRALSQILGYDQPAPGVTEMAQAAAVTLALGGQVE